MMAHDRCQKMGALDCSNFKNFAHQASAGSSHEDLINRHVPNSTGPLNGQIWHGLSAQPVVTLWYLMTCAMALHATLDNLPTPEPASSKALLTVTDIIVINLTLI